MLLGNWAINDVVNYKFIISGQVCDRCGTYIEGGSERYHIVVLDY